MTWLTPVLTLIGALAGSGVISWLAVQKFNSDKKQDDEKNILGWVKEAFKANSTLRDNLTSLMESLKSSEKKAREEADLAWSRSRECDKHRSEQEAEISDLKIGMRKIECDFVEFRKFCESNHHEK